jgi:flagellar assembly factor FliW
MKINTTNFGTQEIDPDTVITFPDGLPGFEDATRFKLFHQEGKQTVHWLQSVDAPDLTFSVVQPELFGIHYAFDLDEAEAARLAADRPDPLMLLLMVYRSDEGEEIQGAGGERVRANLRAPLVINPEKRLGLQKSMRRLEHSMLLRDAG